MTQNTKVLILTGSYGNGHLKVAETLKETFMKYGCNEIVESDLYLDAHPLITKASKFLFLQCFFRGQRIYGTFYYAANIDKKFLKKADLMNNFGMKKLTYLVESFKPDIIINTFPMLVVPEFRKKSGLPIPIVNVITDYVLHKNWMHNEIDKYYVASEELKLKMIGKGIVSEKIKVTGIPINSNFEEKIDKSLLFESYGLDKNKPVTLLSAGAHGVLKDMDEIVNKLLAINDHQVVVVCGKNKKLKEELSDKFRENRHVRIIGFTDKMHDLMRMATVMVTKPGGITLSEALAVQVPLVLYRSVPGQEKGNALFFERNGAAIVVEQSDELIEKVSKLIQNDHLRMTMKHNMKAMYHENAAKVIYEDAMAMVQSKEGSMKVEVI